MISSSWLPSRSRIGSFSGPLGRPRLVIKGTGVYDRSGVLARGGGRSGRGRDGHWSAVGDIF